MKKLSLIAAAICMAVFVYTSTLNAFVYAEASEGNSVLRQDTVRTPSDTSKKPRIPIPTEPIPTPIPVPENPSPTPVPPKEPLPSPTPTKPSPNPVPTPTDPVPKPM